jgi:phospholipid/cholesterol/gamma-HCH transport system ATP-binding protein
MQPSREPLVSLAGVGFAYPESPPLFDALSLEIARGESIGIVGPGGEGKSTLLKMIAGLLRPDRGTCRFESVALLDLPRHKRTDYRRRIGMTFQKSGLFDSLNVHDNLDFPLRTLTRLPRSERERKITAALESVGLAGTGALHVHEMCGGMQKRLGIARALLLEPELVLYDDPTAGLDPVTSRAIVDLIVRLKESSRMTIVVVTSDPALAYPISDRIGFLYRGKFRELAPPEELKKSQDAVVRQFLDGNTEGPLTEIDA